MDRHTPPWEGSPEPDRFDQTCPRELLSAYADNQCSPEERKEAEAHLQACPACREWLEQVLADQQLFTHTLMGRQADLTDAVMRSVSEMSAPEKEKAEARPRRFGNRLTDVLAVTAGLAIIATVFFPVFARSREKARQSSCLSNVKCLLLGLHEFAADHSDTLPSATTWAEDVVPYIGNRQILTCPQVLEGQPVSYAFVSRWSGVKLSSIPDPANTIILYEVENGQPVHRHNDGTNVGYADGHAKWIPKLPPDVVTATSMSTLPPSRNWGLARGVKLAYDAACEVWVENLQLAVTTAEETFYKRGGFVLNSMVEQEPTGKAPGRAQITGKVPTAEVAATVNALTALGYVVRREINGADLTDQYVPAERGVTQAQETAARLQQRAATAPRRQRVALAEQAQAARRQLGAAQDSLFGVKREVALATITATLIEKAPEASRALTAAGRAWQSFVRTARWVGVALIWVALYGLFVAPVGLAVWWWKRRRA